MHVHSSDCSTALCLSSAVYRNFLKEELRFHELRGDTTYVLPNFQGVRGGGGGMPPPPPQCTSAMVTDAIMANGSAYIALMYTNSTQTVSTQGSNQALYLLL